MTLSTDNKNKIIKKFATQKGDTGSPEVQVALITERITQLTKHLKLHNKDNHSRRGLLAIVSKRRRLLNYLKRTSKKRYTEILSKLKLKK
jgi:small subunit ribosomal protein S15